MSINEIEELQMQAAQNRSDYLNLRIKTREVRELQKRYFRTRDRQVLEQSKRAEAELDKMLDGSYEQPKLF